MRPRRSLVPLAGVSVSPLLLLGAALSAQDPSTPPPRELERLPTGTQDAPVVVTASRVEQDPFDAPYSIDVVDRRLIEQRGYRTLPQALRDIPGVLVQETSPGQGSPFIRGFTGFQNLFLIDGIRLNNSVFRTGPNQYWNTVDPLSLDRLEVLKGPAGAQYGSDAIGGTVQAFTKSPYVFGDDRIAYGGSVYTRYMSAEDALMARGEISAGQRWADGSRTGVLLGGDAKAFGDIEAGRSVGTQPDTGYEETAFDLKFEHWLDAKSRVVFLHQQLRQDDVPRTHATTAGISWRGTAVGSDLQRDLDQERQLTYLQYHRTGMDGALQGVHASLSWHRQTESEDRIRSNSVRDEQGFSVDTIGLWLQAESDAGELGQLSYGVEYYRDFVDSHFRTSGTPSAGASIQGPVADDASYDLVGVFVQDALPIGDAAELTFGVRYTYAAVDADAVRDPATNGQISVSDDWDQFTANARLRVDLVEDTWNVFVGASQGFRAPNLSDLTRYETARSGEAEIPVTDLDAEEYISYEIGTKVQGETVSLQAAWFHTDIEDQILRFPTGATNGSGQAIVTKANVGDGYIQGVEFAGAWEFLADTELFGAFTYQYGQIENFDAGGATVSTEYTSRLMPITTMLGLRWNGNDECPFYAETLVTRAEDADRLSAADQRDTQRIPPGGTPSYTVWNAHAGVKVDDRATIDVGIDNITDVDYRVHGSGSNAPGRSFFVGMRVIW